MNAPRWLAPAVAIVVSIATVLLCVAMVPIEPAPLDDTVAVAP